MGAYAVGSLIGRHKMIPRISPGKTWEGFGGAIVVSTGASLVFVHFFGAHMYGMNTLHAVILGVVLSSTAVIGDLIESLFKREAGVKDSGNFFPASAASWTCSTACCSTRRSCICICATF